MLQLEANREPGRQRGAVGDDDQDRVCCWRCRSRSSDATVAADAWIEVAGRLVAQQQARLADQRPGDRHALLLAARQLAGPMVDALASAPPARSASRARAATSARRLPRASRATSVGTSTFSSTEHCGSRQWSWNTNPISRLRKSASAAGVERERIAAVERDVPRRRRLQRAEDVEQRALAAARRPGDRRRLARRERERHVGEHRQRAARRRILLVTLDDVEHGATPPTHAPRPPSAAPIDLEQAVGRLLDRVVRAHAVERLRARARRARSRSLHSACRPSARLSASSGVTSRPPPVFSTISVNAPRRGCTTGTPLAIASSRNMPFGSS